MTKNSFRDIGIVFRVFLWMALAFGAAGTTVFIMICVMEGSTMPLRRLWGWAAVCAVLVPLSITVFHHVDRDRVKQQRRALLYMSDLITMSVAVAVLFAIVKAVAPPADFAIYGILSAAGLLCAMVLALMRASRQGFARGLPRALNGLGTTLTLLGIGGLGIFLFFAVMFLWHEGWSGLGRMMNHDEFTRIRMAGLLGTGGVAGGIALIAWSRSERGKETGESSA